MYNIYVTKHNVLGLSQMVVWVGVKFRLGVLPY